MVKVLIVDDEHLVGEGTKAILEIDGEFSVKYVSTGEAALSLLEQFDIYIIDIYMPNMDGIELSEKLLLNNPHQKIILYAGIDNEENLELFTKVGISGFISKTATKSELNNLIYNILEGNTIVPLSIFKKQNEKEVDTFNKELREKDITILEKISKGFSNKEIAEKLFISERTVEYRLTKIYKNLGVKSRGEAISTAIQLKLLKV